MLDTSTKRRIDAARDILVGKVPDPKSQVEQITIALIYKFMDDMDIESEELGGQRTFFQNEYRKYAWSNIFDPKLGGYEILDLYAEAILKMNVNPNIPQLFRNIFKNAYLPYRDPETLKRFLRIINEFEYDHSEKLGDAFEYLLSVLGSQGDAGQFRTPRHIIDFMVEIIDPQKHETILDPACGTAGFLISAYKHILKHNSSTYKPEEDKRIFEQENISLSELTINGKKYKGDLLTPEQRNLLSQNIKGYDISPDMVRLSLVNMYLHGLQNPLINEYDTLTSEDKWNELADIILANPPFMSPKGGIRPHKRFSIQSNRSEVLFVSYMAEHLTPTGRCAVIVPEGIIFQSGIAYKSLRKTLVENYLVGVISLPAGVFQPYSGVKTSILWLDRNLAKKTDKILFIKIENDGFDLGAQRRPIKLNDLPEAARLISEFKLGLISDTLADFGVSSKIRLVEKIKITENEDYNLSGERYKIDSRVSYSFPMIELGDQRFFKIESGGTPETSKKEYWDGEVKWITLVDLPSKNFITVISDSQRKITNKGVQSSSAKLIPKDSVIVSTRATIGRIAINKVELCTNQGFKNIVIKDFQKVSPKYLAYILTTQVSKMESLASGGTFKEISKSNFSTIQIPIPPLSIQEEIVSEIEAYQKIIDGARQVVENYKPIIDIDPEWEIVKMSEIADVNPESKDPSLLFADWFTYIDISSVENGKGIIDYSNRLKVSDAPSRARRVVQQNDILLSTVRPNLKAFGFVEREPDRYIASTGFALLRTNQKCESKYLYYLVFQDFMVNQMVGSMEKGAYPSINQNDVNNLIVALAPIKTQRQIISQIEKEIELVNGNKQLIEILEQKIKDRIAKVWGE